MEPKSDGFVGRALLMAFAGVSAKERRLYLETEELVPCRAAPGGKVIKDRLIRRQNHEDIAHPDRFNLLGGPNDGDWTQRAPSIDCRVCRPWHSEAALAR
jgi:hypothetical protein